MSTTYTPAEAFPPGEYLRDELEERGWSVTEFAEIIGRPVQAVSEILNGKKEITTDTALALADALGTSPELWLNLQTAFRLHQRQAELATSPLTPVARRARLRSVIPLAEVRSRGWLPATADLDELESLTCALLEISDLDERPQFALAARRSNPADSVTIEQAAWLGHIRQRASEQEVGAFDLVTLEEVAAELPRMLRGGPSELPNAPHALAECGVSLVFAEGLRGGKLDGAVTFLGDGRPVIGLTTRGNRFDSVLFTMLHECAHLTLGHLTAESGSILDDDLTEAQVLPDEVAANEQASNWLFPGGFEIGSTSMPAIVSAASSYGVHASVVVGRIQNDTGNWSQHRSRIPKVRPDLEDAGLLT